MKSPDVFGVLFFVIIMPFARERENHFVNRQDLLGAVKSFVYPGLRELIQKVAHPPPVDCVSS